MIDDAKRRFEELKDTGLLPSPKGVALAVLELSSRANANIQSITRLVQTDPALAGRILRYANAARGGSLRHIASLPHAITFLGLYRVRQIALSFSLIDQYRSGSCTAFDYPGYWTASLATGITAQQVAPHAQCPRDESFTCGLLSGIGRLGLASTFPYEYAELLLDHLGDLALRDAEIGRFGLDHANLSADLLESWGLPEIFHGAVRYHELPDEAPFAAGSRAQALTVALHLARKVGQLLNVDEGQRWERVPSLFHAAARLGLEDHEVPPLVENVVRQWQDWGQELNLPTPAYQDIRSLLAAPPSPAGEGEIAALVVLPLRVALVARDAGSLRQMADSLRAMGLHTEIAEDSQGALKLLRERPPDIAMVELAGADDRSVEQLQALRSEAGRQVYCIALIPPEAEAGVARLMLAGASDYLLLEHSDAALLARLNNAQRVVALQGAVRAEREMVASNSGEWARSNRRLLREALTDPLTQLANRRYGMDRFAQEWSFAAYNDTSLACLMLDIDHFKGINDRHGHDVGDIVLSQLATVLERCCRKSDVLFRFGGEEFCVVCPDTALPAAIQLGERIVRAMRRGSFGRKGNPFEVTVSVGVAVRTEEMTAPEDLLARADKALYAAKKGGRDRVMAARAG